MNLFRTREIIDQGARSGLKKVLGPVDLTLMGIGCIIGAGIFVLTGIAAANQAGPAIFISFALAGTACAFAALSYAELAASLGGSGSAYGYGYAALGEIVGWIIGWDLLLEYGVGVTTVASGWSGYMADALNAIGLHIPFWLTHAPGVCSADAVQVCGAINIPAIVIILLLAGLLALGAKVSARVNAVMVAVKLLALGLFIALALTKVDPSLWHPFLPPRGLNPHGHEAYGWKGMVEGASIIFFAYIGFDSISTAVEETRNPQRNAPIGILASLVICTLLYMVVSLLLTGIVPYKTLDTGSPVSFALQQIGYQWGSAAVAVGAIAGLTTVMLVLFFGLSRIIMAMSRDGLLPGMFAKINPSTGTPTRTILVMGVVMATISGLTPIDYLAKIVNMGTLAAFVVVCAGVIVLRYTRPDMPRPFRTPFSPIIPILGVLSCFYLMLNLPSLTWVWFFAWLVIGLVVYFGYSYRHSALAVSEQS